MNWENVKNMKNEDAPKGTVLVQYLEPSFGYWSVEYAIAYYDNPDDYNDGVGKGWIHWNTSNPINVLAYTKLPETLANPLGNMSQNEMFEKFGSTRPNLGNLGF